jgi:hypothetical protein
MELFYRIADADCAAARRAVLASPLRRNVKFRNVHYPEVQADLTARGGTRLPAFWDGAHLYQGLDAITAFLSAAA